MYDQSILERFWNKVKKTDGCWEWAGALTSRGYGNLVLKGKNKGAHRVSWEIYNGPIPAELCVLHHCDNPSCVNPSHLFIGTRYDNIQDAIRKGRHNTNQGKKLDEQKVLLIRYLVASGVVQAELSRLISISAMQVSNVVLRKQWKKI